jgi:TorA maturation chaperone TorD
MSETKGASPTNASSNAPLKFAARLPHEEAARADLYALLARLFFAAPDAELAGKIIALELGEPGTPLFRAWQGLQKACTRFSPEDIQAEYDETFVGTGRAPVSIYASHYLTETRREMTLVSLRDELGNLGLARKADVSEPEDHLASLLDVMRHLIMRISVGADEDALFAVQQRFFQSYLALWPDKFLSAVEEAIPDGFYRHAAKLLQAMLRLDVESFGLNE